MFQRPVFSGTPAANPVKLHKKIEINANLFCSPRDILKTPPGPSWLRCSISLFDSWTFNAYDMPTISEHLKMVNKSKMLGDSV